jgi:hypothetical protein
MGTGTGDLCPWSSSFAEAVIAETGDLTATVC